MKTTSRYLLLAAVLLIPARGLAQVAPPVPPAPPAPPVAQAPPTPPVPVIAPAPPVALAPMVIFNERLAGLAGAEADARAAMEAGREALEAQRYALAEARDVMRWDNASFQTAWNTSANAPYDAGLSFMSRREYERAIGYFDQVISGKGTRADAALYHKAYAQYRLGRGNDASATLEELRKSHPQSRYLKDASALDTAVRASAGQPIRPEAADDDELKLLAINALQHSDPERTMPLLEAVLNGTNSLQLKQRALFVLAQSSQPRAREILLNYAKGAGNPDLQRTAIQYLSTRGKERATSAELKAIYESTSDEDIKRAVIGAWGTMGDSVMLAEIAASSSAPTALRTTAMNRMSDPEAANTLWSLYQKEQNKELRGTILSRLGSLGAVDRLQDVIRSEKDVELRRRAIRSLGNMRSDKSGAMLADLYTREEDIDNKKSIISALSSQNNGEALVAIARKETNMTLKRDIVSRLSNMPRNKAAMDYMLEIIK
jgi:hypothetical protein